MNRRATAGFTYVEVLMAIVILAGAVVSMSGALTLSRSVQEDADAMDLPAYLVKDGLAQVRLLHRSDPQTPASFGPELGETLVTYDDVDDLDGLVEATPVDLSGVTFAKDWSRVFEVVSVDPANPDQVVADGASNLMRVRVAVVRNGGKVALGTEFLWRP